MRRKVTTQHDLQSLASGPQSPDAGQVLCTVRRAAVPETCVRALCFACATPGKQAHLVLIRRAWCATESNQLPAITELWRCFAERPMSIGDAPADEAVIISEVVIGVGPTCKARDCNS